VTQETGTANCAQFDKLDGIKDRILLCINGAHFWVEMIPVCSIHIIDDKVQNGRTYYYALVAYDMGDPNFGTVGLLPSETTK